MVQLGARIAQLDSSLIILTPELEQACDAEKQSVFWSLVTATLQSGLRTLGSVRNVCMVGGPPPVATDCGG